MGSEAFQQTAPDLSSRLRMTPNTRDFDVAGLLISAALVLHQGFDLASFNGHVGHEIARA